MSSDDEAGIIVQRTHALPRKYLELIQDIIVAVLCLMLFAAMGLKLVHLGQLMVRSPDFSLVLADLLFILVLLELFRLLLIYLEEHRVSVGTMVEVGIVSTLREVILTGVLNIAWPQLVVISLFLISLGLVLRYSGIRSRPQSRAPVRSGTATTVDTAEERHAYATNPK
jgi:uncharacterized membrane protein (DUF373 family)